MEWEKEELRELIESNIDWWWEEMEFAKTLLDVLDKSPTREAFVSSAMSEAGEYYDPWIRDDLCSFIRSLSCHLGI